MRTIEEIKADMKEAIEKYNTDRMNDLYKEEALYYIRDIQVDRLEQICQAEREGRVVVLDKSILPLIWGDDNKETLLCPNCNEDLMGGYDDDCLEIPMWQCPNCGQPINPYKAITKAQAEAALLRIQNKEYCERAKVIDGKCEGLAKSDFDDEPPEMCKGCKKFYINIKEAALAEMEGNE